MSPLVLVSASALLSTLGLSVIFRTFLENLVASLVLHCVGAVRPGRRIKILANPLIIKGDVVSVGPLRTVLQEVGDGEHLPSVRTGRTLKVPNSMLINSPLMLYGDVITDEVIGYARLPVADVDQLLDDMRASIEEAGHRVVEIGLFQRDEMLQVHGIFEVQTSAIADERSKVLKSFLKRRGGAARPPVDLPVGNRPAA